MCMGFVWYKCQWSFGTKHVGPRLEVLINVPSSSAYDRHHSL